MSLKSAFINGSGKFGGKPPILVGLGLVVVACAVGIFSWSHRGEVTGDTAEERIDSIKGLGARDAEVVADAAVNDPDARVRCTAFRALERYITPEVRAAVERGTADKAADVRAAAAMALGKYADDAAAARLGNVLNADQDEKVRLAAARGLARCKTRKAEDLLAAAMQTNTSQKVQIKALKLLLEGKGVRLTPEPDPRDLKAWRVHVEKVLTHLKSTRMGREALGVKE